MNDQEFNMRIWRAQQRTPEEKIDALLSMCVYATLIGVLLLIGVIAETVTLYDYWKYGVPSHPTHPAWLDVSAVTAGLIGILTLTINVVIWLNDANAIYRANQSFQGKPPP